MLSKPFRVGQTIAPTTGTPGETPEGAYVPGPEAFNYTQHRGPAIVWSPAQPPQHRPYKLSNS